MSEKISEKRIQAARANGAKSRGPVTKEGKANSSRNAIRHGLLASTVLVGEECRHNFKSLFDLLVQRFQPADGVELCMIEELAASTWRLRRVWAMESEMLDGAMRDQTAPVEITRITTAFTGLAARPEIHLLHRYETRLHMMYQRSLHNLRTMRQADMRNEPGNSLIPREDPGSMNPGSPDFEPNEPVFLPPGPVRGHESAPEDTAPGVPEPPSAEPPALEPTAKATETTKEHEAAPMDPLLAARHSPTKRDTRGMCRSHHRRRPVTDRRKPRGEPVSPCRTNALPALRACIGDTAPVTLLNPRGPRPVGRRSIHPRHEQQRLSEPANCRDFSGRQDRNHLQLTFPRLSSAASPFPPRFTARYTGKPLEYTPLEVLF